MWKNSTELLDYALREIKEAIKQERTKIRIVLEECYTDEREKVLQYCEKLELKTITEILREEFENYTIKSVVASEDLNAIITFKRAPCAIFYSLIWTLTLQKK